MKPVSLCVTTFNRQDLLGVCLRSVYSGTIVPDRLYLIDQANRPDLLNAALSGLDVKSLVTIDLAAKRGCEGSAINWYLEHVAEERVIAHEDVVFAPDSLARFLAAEGDFLIDASLGVLTYRDACREKAGLYDVTISPNYFRYVDVDYEDRLAQVGIHPTVVDCGIRHLENGTLKGYAAETVSEYHHRHEIARVNYERKWGRSVTPGGNTIGRGAWRRGHV